MIFLFYIDRFAFSHLSVHCFSYEPQQSNGYLYIYTIVRLHRCGNIRFNTWTVLDSVLTFETMIFRQI